MKKIFKKSMACRIEESTCNVNSSEENKIITKKEKVFDLASIQARLRDCIAESSYTQRQIAKEIGVSAQTVSKYMKKDIFPALDTLAKLCKVLDVPSDYILCLIDEY